MQFSDAKRSAQPLPAPNQTICVRPQFDN